MVCWLLYTVSELELDTVSSHTCTSKAGPTMTSIVPIQIQGPAKVVFRIIRKTWKCTNAHLSRRFESFQDLEWIRD